MSSAPVDEPNQPRALRLWPGVVVVVLQWAGRFGVPIVVPEAAGFGVLGGLVGGLAIFLWWGFFSRAPRSERVGAIVVMVVAMVVTSFFLHESVATGAQGMTFPIYVLPVLSLAFVVWAVASRGLSGRARRATMVAAIVLSCAVWTLFRTDGLSGNASSDFAWRWSPTPEEQLLARADDEPTAPPVSAVPEPDAKIEADWPGFRGSDRDGVIDGVQIVTDWDTSPPIERWRRPIGPGWSSFAVRGDLLYTQEQRGDDECVSCYRATTGEPVWRHRDPARFWESNAGAGPRATPTLHRGRVYAFGATGILNVLDARDGSVVWSRSAASDTDTEVPGWGFASSPLVMGDVVIVATAGQLAAYDLTSGDPRWFGPGGGGGYSSPHRVTIDGVPQILLLSEAGATSVEPSDGTPLWQYSWPGDRIVQPARTASGDLLIPAAGAMGGTSLRRIAVTHAGGTWTLEERWTSRRLRPYFNDFVAHEGHAYGFDNGILACIDLEEGGRQWKGGRYGNGQLLLLADQDVLLVLSEQGELALVAAAPDQFKELARVPAIEGKTWNHPVLVGELLLVRNAEEMAAFRLTLVDS